MSAFSFNMQILFGNVGKDPVARDVGEKKVLGFSLATERSYKDKTGTWVNETTWHDLQLWNPSDYILKNVVKGAQLLVVGETNKRNYENKEGQKVYVTEVNVNSITFAGSRNGNGNTTANEATGANNGQQGPAVASEPQTVGAQNDAQGPFGV